ncbi:MAG: ATP-binding protein [Bacteroidota bacterium]
MRILLFLFGWLSAFIFLHGQPAEPQPFAGPGAPLIQYFSPLEYKASPSNYALAQAPNGIMYIANEEGVLEFDGAHWRLIQLPNKGRAHSISVNDEGTIFVGGESEFGYLHPDETGQLAYQSLLEEVPPSQAEFGRVEALVTTSNGVYFSTTRCLFRWAEQKLDIWEEEEESGFYLGFKVRDEFYCERMNQGLLTVRADTLFHFGLDEAFQQHDYLRAIVALPDPWPYPMLTLMASGKLWGYAEGKAPQLFAVNEALGQYLIDNQADRMLALSDGRLAFSTLKGGIVIMNADGNLDQLIDQHAGLKGASPSQLFEDQQGGLWIAMDNGLSRVELTPSFSHYTEAQGLEGGAIQIRKFGDQLYVGNRLGLFRLYDQMTPFQLPFFQQVPEIPGGFTALEQVGERLFVGTSQSLSYVRTDGSLSGSTEYPIVKLHYVPREDKFLWLVFYDGMILMVNDPTRDSWFSIAHVPSYVKEASSIIHDREGNLWVDYGYEEVLRLGFADLETMLDTSAINEYLDLIDLMPEMQSYGPEKGVPLGNKKVFRIGDQILAGTLNGLKIYDPEQDRFLSTKTWGPPSMDTTYAILDMALSVEGDIWISYEKEEMPGLGRLVKQKDGSYNWEEGLLKRFIQASPITTFYPDPSDNEVIWVGNSEEVVRWDLHRQKEPSPNLKPLIRTFSTKGIPQALVSGLSIDYTQNGATFSYGLPTFSDPKGTTHQYKLEGFETEWSSWTSVASKEYTQLSEGTYTFWVRARDSEGIIYEADAFTFNILPPWYRSWWAYLLYLVLSVGLVFFLVRFYSQYRLRQLQARNEELEQTVEERTIEIRQALENLKTTQDQLIVQEKMASLGQLTMGVAHEIKNPLNFVKNFAEGTGELLNEFEEDWQAYQQAPDPEDLEMLQETFSLIQKNNQRIIQNGDRANEIVNGMMNHANDNRSEKSSVDLNQLVKESLTLGYNGFQDPENPLNVQVETTFAEDLPTLQLHAQDIRRVLINLINNACYALQQKTLQGDAAYTPALRVSTHSSENELIIRIRDNGTGVAPEDIDRIFEPFFTTKPTGQGNVGLGLSISYDLITKGHQGRMEIHSEKGEFTEVEIGLPL